MTSNQVEDVENNPSPNILCSRFSLPQHQRPQPQPQLFYTLDRIPLDYKRTIPDDTTPTPSQSQPPPTIPWMSQFLQNPDIRVANPTPPLDFDPAYDYSALTAGTSHTSDWQMYGGYDSNNFGGGITPQQPSLKRQRTHQRTPSASTINSNGPQSPFDHTTSHPYVASVNASPQPSSLHNDFAKNYQSSNAWNTADSIFSNPGSGYVPSAVAHTPSAHLAMKDFAIDHHTVEDAPGFTHSGRQSMSSHGQSSPSTPRSGAGEEVESNKMLRMQHSSEGKTSDSWERLRRSQSNNDSNQQQSSQNNNPSLFRTESAAFQDELYNPANFTSASNASTKPPVPTNSFLTPHRNLVNERLQTANIARSVSPSSAVSRERSPFRQGSPYLAQATDSWNSPRPGMGTAAGMRQQQKEETEQAEYAQHKPSLRREPTKTISPKDALLDYNESDQAPLFQDTIPSGYQQHFGGTDKFPSTLINQPSNATMGSSGMPAFSPQQIANFRATSSDGLSGPTNFNFATPGLQNQQMPSAPFQADTYRPASNSNNGNNSNGTLNPYSANPMAEPAPDFPAHLTSMESSMSDGGPTASSQEENNFNTSAPSRPSDTRAATGTYTCTYHGCTQRFDSSGNLQRHKREVHRTQHQREGTASATSSSSPPASLGTESPGPAGNGMTSAALLARNSQAGPHKCTRINPSTNKPCNTIFSRPYDLTRHEDTIHNNRKQKVRCPMCREEKTFSRNDALTRHMRVVHPEVEAFAKRSSR
ncbi:hypothetical protein MBLNU230_g4119t1 [Neophaeotheca triangularis]